MPDETGKVGDLKMGRDGEAVAEIIPEGDAEFGTGLGQAEQGVAAIAPDPKLPQPALLPLLHPEILRSARRARLEGRVV